MPEQTLDDIRNDPSTAPGIPAPQVDANIPRGHNAEPLLQFFSYAHLPEKLKPTSELFYQLAAKLVQGVPRNPERTVALRKLLEAKDCAVRALIWQG